MGGLPRKVKMQVGLKLYSGKVKGGRRDGRDNKHYSNRLKY